MDQAWGNGHVTMGGARLAYKRGRGDTQSRVLLSRV